MKAGRPRSALGERPEAIEGITPGSAEHQILLALRAPGGMTAEQIKTRFGDASGALYRLSQKQMIVMPPIGTKGTYIKPTAKALELTSSDGPLCRRKTLNTYCQL